MTSAAPEPPEGSTPPTSPHKPVALEPIWTRPRDLARLVFKISLVVVLILLVIWASFWAKSVLDHFDGPPWIKWGLVLIMLLAYALLLAIPFIPGLEIGIFVMMLDGGALAPFAYLAALVGLSISFYVGRAIGRPVRDEALLERVLGLFRRLRLQRAGELLVKVIPLSPAERLNFLYERLPSWISPRILTARYLLLAVLLNVPGNTVLGGGGGLALLAGISGTFGPIAGFVALALGLAPLPLIIYFGAGSLQAWLFSSFM